ncbi:methyl-accepting chemotaxis protein [Undibacterium sp. Ji83W]|uniref:methyl-accepting chemotaxis protein n=1 Tax=Undibacterium sp. Ji83W TaxID=3413043 RepID=UPI003BF39F11
MSGNKATLVDKIMYPCTVLMSKLSLRTKLLGIFVILLLPLLFFASLTLNQIRTDAINAHAGLAGVEANGLIMKVIIQTQKHRGQVNLKLSGENLDEDLAKTRTELKNGLNQLDQFLLNNAELALQGSWKASADELQQLVAGQIAANVKDNVAQHSRLIRQSLQFSALLSEKTGLLTDTQSANFLLLDISIRKMPVWIEHMALLRGLGASYIKTGAMEFPEKAGIVSRLDALQASMNGVADLDEAMKRAGVNVNTAELAAFEASQSFAALARKNLLAESISGDANAYFTQGTQAIEKTLALQTQMQGKLAEILKNRSGQMDLYQNLLSLGIGIVVVLSCYLAMGFYRGFMSALNQVGRAAHSVAAGDLTNHIRITGKDELAKTGNLLEAMNGNLSKLVANVRSNASMVAQLGEGLATNISDLTVRTEQQASSLEQTSASVDDLADTVKKNADSARAVDNLAANLRLITESTGDDMRAAVDSMNGIHQSARKVQEIVSLIDGISFQTDILALNAAVEASRAGEHGRGFAVVASEVRSLAQRSADSARQIRRLIDDSVHRVDQGVNQISNVNQTLTEIVGGIRDLANNINAISVASSEQSNGLSQISEALRHLDGITQSNAQMAEQAKHASISLEDKAHALTRAASAFKLLQGTADEAYALVKKAVAIYQSRGRPALQIITANADKLYADRDMYVFAFDRNGQYLAFAGNAAKLKVNLFHVDGLDGRKLVRDAFALPETGGWVNYTIVNPVSKKTEAKTSYIEAVEENLVLGCGVYQVE